MGAVVGERLAGPVQPHGLDRLVDPTWELERGKLFTYEGGWDAYLQGKADRFRLQAFAIGQHRGGRLDRRPVGRGSVAATVETDPSSHHGAAAATPRARRWTRWARPAR